MKFRILDLFCGAGGLSYGFEKNKNFKTVLAIDNDHYALRTLKKNFKDTEVICGDITNKEIKQEIVLKSIKNNVNMIIGGPPCQGFSLKGKKRGLNDPRNYLFLEFLELVSKIKPEVFVIENVKNLIFESNGFFINEIKLKFEKLGYIINYNILDSKDYGVPQSRKRAIIIGSKSRFINFPKPTMSFVTIKDAISDISFLESGEGEFESEYINEPTSEYQLKMRKNSTKLYNHVATKHSKIALEKLKLIPPEGDKKSMPKKMWGKQQFSCTWSRLKWNDISPTIDTRFDTPSNGRNSHPVLNRSITPREAARIQSFDDSFIFLGTKTSICKQIGNAVPPLLAKAIADIIFEAYKNKIDLYNNDCKIIIKKLIRNNEKVNHIITDPPYNISKSNNLNTLKNRKGIDFGEWDKNFDLFNWIDDCVKILDKNGSIIIFCSYLEIGNISKILIKKNLIIKDVLIWKKNNPMPRNVERRYVQDLEFAIWATWNKAKWIFNKPKNKPYLRSIFEFPIVSGKEKTLHPTQKSLQLMNEIIKIHTLENDLILDPFMGSGTTGVACVNQNRRFIGIEKNELFFNIAKERIKKTIKNEKN